VRTLKHLSLGILFLLVCSALSWAEDKKLAENRRVAQDKPLTGLWGGEYAYPKDSGQEPVKFTVVLIQDGNTVAGFMKEPNTFGKRNEPWLHAVFKGRLDQNAGKITFTKTYDGTAGEDHNVEYSGQVSEDGTKIEGTWTIKLEGQPDFSGGFTLKKQRLDKETLENLK